MPAAAASIAPLSEDSSQGCAIAVASGCSALVAAIRRSCFSCWRGSDATALFVTALLPPRWTKNRPSPCPRSPFQEQGGLARHALGEADDLRMQLEAERAQLLEIEFVCGLGEAFERARPFRIGDVDAPAAVAAEAAGERHHLHLVAALLGGDADGPVDAVKDLGMNLPLHECVVQLLLLLRLLFFVAPRLVHLRRFGVGGDLHQVLGT